MAYDGLDEMVFRGNVIAATRKSELRLLEDLLNRTPLPALTPSAVDKPLAYKPTQAGSSQYQIERVTAEVHSEEQNSIHASPGPQMYAGDHWGHELNSEQLLALADSLDLDGIDWMTMSDSNVESNLPE